jgi:hypothetical protein
MHFKIHNACLCEHLFLETPTFGFFSMVPNPMYPAKNSKNKKSVQVLKHWVSNVLIFQCKMTSTQSNSKGERESEAPFILTQKKGIQQRKPTPRNLCLAMPHCHHLQSLSTQKTL